jgi:PAS domain S-box-containing protein
VHTSPELLIIDDDLATQEFLEALLSLDDIVPLQAYSRQEAVAVFEAKEPSVIVFDYHLGEDTGLDIFQDLVKRKAKPFLAFMLTAMDAKEVKKDAFEAGIQFFIEKPLDPIEFRGIIKNAFQMVKKFNGLNGVKSTGTLYDSKEFQKLRLQALERLSHRTEESQADEFQTLRFLIDHVDDIVLQMTQSHQIVFVNEAWPKLLGYGQIDTLGSRLEKFIHHEDLHEFERSLENARTIQYHSGSLVEFRLLTKEKLEFWVEARIKMFLSPALDKETFVSSPCGIWETKRRAQTSPQDDR